MEAMALLSRLALLLVITINFKMTNSAICEPIRIPMCQWLPYNLTKMPNLVSHSSQRNAQLVLEQYQPLVDQNCSKDLLFFLCAMFAPMCPLSFNQTVIPPSVIPQAVIPPCRGVCIKARNGCEPVLRRYNMTWPETLKCEQLPLYDKGVCISPESIVTIPDNVHETQPRPKKKSQKLPRCDLQISNDIKLKELFIGNKYKFAMTAVYNHVETLDDQSLMLHVTPRYVFYMRHKRQYVRSGIVQIWLPMGCSYRKIKPGKNYLFMGYENSRRQRLVLNGDSYVKPWRPKTLRRLKKWKRMRTYQKRLIKKKNTKQRKMHKNGKQKNSKKTKLYRGTQKVEY